jgi:hypothetical protein
MIGMDKEAGGCHMLIVKVTNDDSGSALVGNYDYEVLINQTVIRSGRVENHVRRQGWKELVRRVLMDTNKGRRY